MTHMPKAVGPSDGPNDYHRPHTLQANHTISPTVLGAYTRTCMYIGPDRLWTGASSHTNRLWMKGWCQVCVEREHDDSAEMYIVRGMPAFQCLIMCAQGVSTCTCTASDRQVLSFCQFANSSTEHPSFRWLSLYARTTLVCREVLIS